MSLSFLTATAEAPDRIALIVGGAAYSFAALAPRVRARMAALARDHQKSARVAIVARSALDEIILLYALIELGRPAVLLHPRLTAFERHRFLEQVAPVHFLDEDAIRFAPTATATAPDPQALSNENAVRFGIPAPTEPELERQSLPDDERDLAILCTSGTSGPAKAVRLSRRAFAFAARASAEVLGFRDDDRWLLCLPFAHVGGLSVLTRCLLSRRTVVVAAQSAGGGAAENLAAMAQNRVTLISLVPAQLQQILALPDPTPPPSLRAVLLGGAAASQPLVDAALARGWPVLPTYGLTEACSQVATLRPGERRTDASDCGRPLPGIDVRAPDGTIQVRGANLFSGYLHEDARGALTDDGWLVTNDAGFLDEEGRLHVLGRRDRMIVTGGENVAPVEVEQALEACPGVAAACVFGVPDPVWGELVVAALVAGGHPARPAATATVSASANASDEELLAFLATSLAGYKRPRRIAWLAAIPLLPSGKPDLAAVRAAALPLLRSFRVRAD